MKKQNLIFIIFFLGMFFSLAGYAQASNWFVDNNVPLSGNGQGWGTAWKNFSNIQWDSIVPGDTLYISGGATSQIYNEKLEIIKSGNVNKPITISIGQDSPHNGKVIINQTGATDNQGIYLANQTYINITGKVGNDPTPRLQITKTYYSGIQIDGSAHHINLSNLEIGPDAGGADGTYGILYSDNLTCSSSNPMGSVHDCSFHDNTRIVMKISASSDATDFGWLDVYNNDFYDNGVDLIYLNTGGVNIYNNKLHDRRPGGSTATGGVHPDGVQGSGSYVKIYNNSFYNWITSPDDTRFVDPNILDGANSDIRFVSNEFRVNTSLSNIYIYNNTFLETRIPNQYNGFRGLELFFASTCASVSNVYIANNVWSGMPYFVAALGFSTGQTVSNFNFSNNVLSNSAVQTAFGPPSAVLIVGNGGNANVTFGSEASGAAAVIDHNIVYASSSNFKTDVSFNESIMPYDPFKASSHCQVNDASSPINPLLNADGSLQASSPAIDKGMSLATFFTTDKDGTSRPQGSAWDIGAYEYTTGQQNCLTKGDFTCNGYSISDLQTMISIILGTDTTTSRTQADMSTPPDGLVNISDLQLLIKKVLGIN